MALAAERRAGVSAPRTTVDPATRRELQALGYVE